MIGKLHISNNYKIFACCDKDLVGKTISSDNIKLSSSFYGTQIINKQQVIDHLNKCDSANIFGKKVCDFLLSIDVITKEQIIYIDNIPHVHIYKI
jgi:hypothetical protein